MYCKICSFTSQFPDVLLKHHRVRHGFHGTRWPCFHSSCVCSFKTAGSLRCHLSRCHTKPFPHNKNGTFKCELCDYKDICDAKLFFRHLGIHLRSHDTVRCPFNNCNFKTNCTSTFSSHKSRLHKNHTVKDFRASNAIVNEVDGNNPDEVQILDREPTVEIENELPTASALAIEKIDSLTLQHKLASLFLCMQTVLHVSRQATKKILEELNDLVYLSSVHAHQAVKDILRKHKKDLDDSIVQEVIKAVFRTNPLYQTSKKGVLSTDYRRNVYFKGNFPVIEPTEYLFDRQKKVLLYMYQSI